MLHRIKGLFQKISNSKVENKSNFHGRLTAGNGTQEHIQQNQHGRSMTEMLGVLAIMGILSIGALAGYRYAMDKQRANATMNDINLRGVDLIIQASRNIDLNLDEWSNTSTAGYTFGTPEHVADGFVKLPISGLPERVCEMVVDGLSGQYDMDINGAQIATGATCGDDNIITVYFDATGPIGDDECGGCPGAQTCVDGVCTCTNGGTGEDCEKDLCEGVSCGECQKCQNGTCVTKDDYAPCPNGYCEMGFCVSNENPVTGGACTTSEDCENSCMYCENGSCVGKDEGASCEENGTCSSYWNGSKIECIFACSESKPLRDSEGKCYSCEEVNAVYVYGVTSNCAVCDNRKLDGNYCILSECPSDKPLMASNGTCYSCTTTSRVNVSGVTGNCAACGNRKLSGSYCILSECPADKPLMASNGTCYSCNTPNSVYVSNTESCSVCPNRKLDGNYCISVCPDDAPLMNGKGNCFSCDNPNIIWSAKNCSVCLNREEIYGRCILSECPADRPLRDKEGRCLSCGAANTVYVRGMTENCAICPNRKLRGDYCVISKCPINNPLQDYYGDCYSCNTLSSVYVSNTGNCSVCPNRKLDASYCILSNEAETSTHTETTSGGVITMSTPLITTTTPRRETTAPRDETTEPRTTVAHYETTMR